MLLGGTGFGICIENNAIKVIGFQIPPNETTSQHEHHWLTAVRFNLFKQREKIIEQVGTPSF